ncbi:MAG: hypothetical protein JRK53_09745 [Deltaproteobacteria bacterium]|nr:hypothetical protein [Deltaproteobacteria bacterium]
MKTGGAAITEKPRKSSDGHRYLRECAAVAVILIIALGVRLLYQSESIVNRPIRADAAKYVKAAYNLKYFGVYSLETPRKPTSNTDLSPGFPLFLTIFTGKAGLNPAVLKVQAVMGALVCVFTFVLARMALAYGWALAAGILTALCPHLIALDYYLLTESLFTFAMTLGLLLLAVAWKTNRLMFALSAGLALAISARIRAVNMLIVFWMASVFLYRAQERLFSSRAQFIKQISLLMLGLVFVTASYRLFIHHTKATVAHTEVAGEGGAKYTDMSSTVRNWGSILIPPDFYVKEQSHIHLYHRDRTYKRRTDSGFWENPLPYLRWNLWGRLRMLWHWDNAYNGDVYIYPMTRKGFEENGVLKGIYRSMRAMHWPLFMLSLAAPVVLFVKWRRKTLPIEQRMLLVPALAFVYFLGVLWMLWMLTWLPRYTIPARPLSYILAAASLCWLFDAARRRKTVAQNVAGGLFSRKGVKIKHEK